MARIENCLERTLEAVANLPRTGQIEPGVYVTRRPADNGGLTLGLAATWDGAVRLAEDRSYRYISIERNPNLVLEPDVIRFQTTRVVDGVLQETRATYRRGMLEGVEPGQARVILRNLSQVLGKF